MDANPAADPFAITTLDQLLALYDAPRELVLKKVNLKMIIVPCHLNSATWSLGGPLLPKMI